MFKTLIKVLWPSIGWGSCWVNWQHVFPRRLHNTGDQRSLDRLLFTVSPLKEVMDREMTEVIRIKGWVSGSMNWMFCPVPSCSPPPSGTYQSGYFLLHTEMSGGILVSWYVEEGQRYICVIVLFMHGSVGVESFSWFLRADPKLDWHETSSGLKHICKKSVNLKNCLKPECASLAQIMTLPG